MKENLDDMVKEWLARHSINNLSELKSLRKNKLEITCKAPSNTLGLVSLILAVFEHGEFLANDEILVCISARDQWSEDFEKLGNRLIGLLLNKDVTNEKIVVSIFEKNKRLDLVVFILSCSIFQWDVYILPKADKNFIFLNHDGLIQLYTSDLDKSSLVQKELDHWNPTVKPV